MSKLLLYVTGHAPEEIANELGDYVPWFEGLAPGVPFEPIDGLNPGNPIDVRAYAGVVITGSPASLTAPEPWMEAAVELIREADRAGTPLLGVCFGHQLIGAAFGASVIENPAGWEISTHQVELSSAGARDPLFADLPPAPTFNFSHRDIIDPDSVSAFNRLAVLASNGKAVVQALAAGNCCRGVQFHPEFTGPIMRAYVNARRDDLAADANRRETPHERPDELARRAQDAPHGRRLFANWLRHFVERA